MQMHIFNRKVGEKLIIMGKKKYTIQVMKIKSHKVRLGVNAPKGIVISWKELDSEGIKNK